ncbi:ERF family protein [Lederbergia galactosidilytica]|uniref:ERF family protein n=1 Tax=Lederbergia galactosidilytica TaxID=217031 RepID=UPI0009ED046B|nr:ERF family protein [Lederbergia galactosidilytica]
MSTKLTEKLLAVQRQLKAPKGQYNSFGKYSYRSAEDILEAVKPLNAEQGLLLTLTDEPILIGDWHYIKATATITDGENNHSVTAYARESETKKGMDSSQITGTASSYARKYALNGLYLIDDTKDADTDSYHKQNNNAPRNNTQSNSITSEQVGLIKTKAKQFAQARNRTEQEVYDVLKITDITQLTEPQAESVIKQLDAWLNGLKKENKIA